MNFTPPRRWLQADSTGAKDSAAAAAFGNEVATKHVAQAADAARAASSAAAPLHLRGVLPPAGGAAQTTAFAPQGLAVGDVVPSTHAQVRLAGRQSRPTAVTVTVGDFTREALAIADLRHRTAAAYGWLPAEGAPGCAEDMLDGRDPNAVHLVARAAGQLVGCMRLLGPCTAHPPEWAAHVGPRHQSVLWAMRPAVEASGLAVAHVDGAEQIWRSLVQAAAYAALLGQARYLLTAAPPPYAGRWASYGLQPTGLGTYVPAQRPYVTEIYAADLRTAYAGARGLRHWHALFAGTHAALAGEAPAGLREGPPRLYGPLSAIAQRLADWRQR